MNVCLISTCARIDSAEGICCIAEHNSSTAAQKIFSVKGNQQTQCALNQTISVMPEMFTVPKLNRICFSKWMCSTFFISIQDLTTFCLFYFYFLMFTLSMLHQITSVFSTNLDSVINWIVETHKSLHFQPYIAHVVSAKTYFLLHNVSQSIRKI